MEPGEPDDGIPDIYVVPLGYEGIAPAGYNSPDEPDFGYAYADPDIDKIGIFIDADGATIG